MKYETSAFKMSHYKVNTCEALTFQKAKINFYKWKEPYLGKGRRQNDERNRNEKCMHKMILMRI